MRKLISIIFLIGLMSTFLGLILIVFYGDCINGSVATVTGCSVTILSLLASEEDAKK